MFHSCIKLGLLAVMLVHSLLGCCIHHVHAVCASDHLCTAEERVEAEPETHAGCCHAARSRGCEPSETVSLAVDEQTDSNVPEHEHGCCEETHCVYLHDLSTPVCLDLLLPVALFLQGDFTRTMFLADFARAEAVGFDDLALTTQAVRCALHQVWLL